MLNIWSFFTNKHRWKNAILLHFWVRIAKIKLKYLETWSPLVCMREFPQRKATAGLSYRLGESRQNQHETDKQGICQDQVEFCHWLNSYQVFYWENIFLLLENPVLRCLMPGFTARCVLQLGWERHGFSCSEGPLVLIISIIVQHFNITFVSTYF